MALVEAKCTNCGAKLEVDNTKDAAVCPACNTPFIVEKAINNITNNVTNENHINASNVTIVQNESILMGNGIYDGETKQGKPHGYGVRQYSDGSKYEGNWLAGKKYGKGIITYSDGSKYEGNWLDSKKCGEGTIIYADGSKWSGEWKDDKPYNGNGRIPNWYKDIIDYYDGELKNGKASGNATWVYCNGKSWTGIAKDNEEITGEGYIVYFDDDNAPFQSFEGKIKNGKHDINGEWKCFNGSFEIDDIRYDITNNTLDFVSNNTSLPVRIPNGVTKIKQDCGGLWDQRVIICPETLTEFNVEDSDVIRSLEEFEAPGIKEILDNIFYGLEKLKSVKLEGVTSIGQSAFSNCQNLSVVEIPNVEIIHNSAFENCGALQSIFMQNVVTIYNSAFKNCGALQSVFIPNVKIISDNCFYECALSKELTIDNVVEIGSEAFYNSKIINLFAPNLTVIKSDAFNRSRVENVVAPNLKLLEKAAFYSCEKLKNIDAPELSEIGTSAFAYCIALESFSSKNVVLIKNYAFKGCKNLVKVDCPQAKLELSNVWYHFVDCDKLQEIHLAREVNVSKLQKKTSTGGCYVATCVYGSYDCPQVWTLRRFRDDTLASTWYGRAFIRTYYTVSPTLVKWFGNTNWFKDMWKPTLDYMVLKLNYKGVSNKPYNDK